MNNKNKELLKYILSIPTYFEYEYRIKTFLKNYGKHNQFKVYEDKKGNIYLIKGKLNKNEYYPNLCAHLDSVFKNHISLAEKNQKKIIKQIDNKLIAYHPDTLKRTGIAGDDLAGVFIALKVAEQFDKIQLSFFVEEEYGYLGSRYADEKYFENVGYNIEFDAPTNNWYSKYLFGNRIYSDNFHNEVKNILNEQNIDNFSYDPYTDMLAISERFNLSCANLPAGYYNYHTDNEYVNIDDVKKGIITGIKFINKLKLKRYNLNIS